jgi:hypothetical protein
MKVGDNRSFEPTPNNRAITLRLSHIEAWVAPIYWRPTFDNLDRLPVSWSHERAIELALKMGITVAPGVLADYPQLA